MIRSPYHELLERQGRLVARGDLHAAEQICQALVHQAPSEPLAWIALGDLRLAQGRVREAVDATSRATAIAPENPDCLLRHVRALFAAGERGRGLASLAVVAGRQLLDDRQASLVGALYCQAELPERAITFLRRAVDAAPANGRYLYNLAACQRMTGDFEAAWRNCGLALEGDPDDAEAALLRAELNRAMRQPHDIARLRGALARAEGGEKEIVLRFALVRECEDAGYHDEAFHHALAGNRLKRARMRYDVGEDIAVLDALRESHDRATIAAMTPGFRTPAPIFIMGLPRTGTTLVERILGGHDDVVSAGEPLAFSKALSRQLAARKLGGGKVQAIRDSLSLDMDELGRAYVGEIRDQISDGSHFIDKLPLNYLYAGLIRAALPDARIIFVERDPMDSLWAIYKTLFAKAYPFSYDLAELSRYQAAYSKLVAHWTEQFGDAILCVRYEDVVADLDGQARRIISHCGLVWQDECRDFMKSAVASTSASAVQVRMPLYSESVGLWKEYRIPLAEYS